MSDQAHAGAQPNLGGRAMSDGEKWLRKSAEMGNVKAMHNLGWRLLDAAGLPHNEQEGEMWLKRAISLNYDPALSALGWRLLDGKGITQNVAEGERLLREATNKGNTYAM